MPGAGTSNEEHRRLVGRRCSSGLNFEEGSLMNPWWEIEDRPAELTVSVMPDIRKFDHRADLSTRVIDRIRSRQAYDRSRQQDQE